jgi:hypothetical protein
MFHYITRLAMLDSLIPVIKAAPALRLPSMVKIISCSLGGEVFSCIKRVEIFHTYYHLAAAGICAAWFPAR